MNFKKDYLDALSHKKPEHTPVFFTVTHSVGFGASNGPWFEKGPVGGGFDGFGVRWATPSSGGGAPTPAPDDPILKDAGDWKEVVKFPDLDAFDWEAEAQREMEGCDREEKVVDYGCGNGVFERLFVLMGMEGALCSLMLNPDEVNELFEAITDFKIKIAEKAAKYYKPDFFTNYDDVASEVNLFFSPEVYRSLIKSHHKRLNEAIISLGMKPIYHCCGKAETLIEDFIDTKAIAWTSVQPCNDIESILQKYGEEIAIIGGFNSNGKPGMSDATEEEVRAEVRRCIDTYGNYGSYAVFGARLVNSLDPQEIGNAYVPIVDEGIRYAYGSIDGS